MKRLLMILLIVSGFTSCQTANVVSFYNEEIDFGKYRTFALINPANRNEKLSLENKQSDELIEMAISRELNFRGYRKEEPADLWVYYRVILDTNVNYRVDNYSPYYYDPYSNVQTTEYREGILMIEMKDPATRKTVWQGSLDLKYKTRKKSKVDPLSNAMKLIFEEYPFKAGQSDPVIQPED